MSDILIPFGPLVSWGSVLFTEGRSKLLSGWKMGGGSSHGMVLGQTSAFDRFGTTRVPVEFTYTWEYLLRTDAVTTMQDWMNSFMQYYAVSQVQTLKVRLYGDMSLAVGPARLEDLTEVDGYPTYKRLNLTFFTTGLVLGT